MGAGFYMMIAISIVIYQLAIADKKTGWIWFAINCAASMVLGKLFGLTIKLALLAGLLTYLIMFICNLISPSKLDQ